MLYLLCYLLLASIVLSVKGCSSKRDKVGGKNEVISIICLRFLISVACLKQQALLCPSALISFIMFCDAFGLLRLRVPHFLAEAGDVPAELVVGDVVVVVVHFCVAEVVVVGHPADVAELAARGPRHVDLRLLGEVLGGGGEVGPLVRVHVVEHLHVAGVALDLDLVLAQQKGRREAVAVVVEGRRGPHSDQVDLACAVLGGLHLGRGEINNHLLRVGSVYAPHGEQVLAGGEQAGSFGFIAVHGY